MQPTPPSIPRTFSSSQTETLRLRNTDFPCLPPRAPGSHPPAFGLCEFHYSSSPMQVESDSICPLTSDLFHSAWGPQGPSILKQLSEFPSFSRLSSTPTCIYTAFCLPVRLPVDAGCFHRLAVAKSIALNIGVHTPAWIPLSVLQRPNPEVELLGHTGIVSVIFLVSRHPAFQHPAPFDVLVSGGEGFQVLHILTDSCFQFAGFLSCLCSGVRGGIP